MRMAATWFSCWSKVMTEKKSFENGSQHLLLGWFSNRTGTSVDNAYGARKSNNLGVVAQSPEPGAHVLNARAFRIELEFRNVGFCGEGKTGVPGEKPLGAENRTNNKLNPHMTSSPGTEPGPHWWKASALTTAPSLFLNLLDQWQSGKLGTGSRVSLFRALSRCQLTFPFCC